MASYHIEITSRARVEIRQLPGNMRQRLFREIQNLQTTACPPHSKSLNATKLETTLPEGIDPRRLRIEHWRVVYVVERTSKTITVLAIRKRPPYDYGDLSVLLERVK